LEQKVCSEVLAKEFTKNSRHDEWLDNTRVFKFTEANLQRAKQMQKQATEAAETRKKGILSIVSALLTKQDQ